MLEFYSDIFVHLKKYENTGVNENDGIEQTQY